MRRKLVIASVYLSVMVFMIWYLNYLEDKNYMKGFKDGYDFYDKQITDHLKKVKSNKSKIFDTSFINGKDTLRVYMTSPY